MVRRRNELANLPQNAVCQDGASLSRCSRTLLLGSLGRCFLMPNFESNGPYIYKIIVGETQKWALYSNLEVLFESGVLLPWRHAEWTVWRWLTQEHLCWTGAWDQLCASSHQLATATGRGYVNYIRPHQPHRHSRSFLSTGKHTSQIENRCEAWIPWKMLFANRENVFITSSWA